MAWPRDQILPVHMSERTRLLAYLIAILVAVALGSAAVTAFQLHYAPAGSGMVLAVAEILLLVIAGGTALVRVCNPFFRRLEDKAAQLAKINRDLDDFSYVASHDLKEPLRGISAYCQILLEDYGDKLDNDGERRLRSLVGLCQRLGRLIDDLLTYSQLGRTQPATEPADLNEIVGDVIETLGPAIDDRNAIVRIDGVLPVLKADRVLAGEVFRNLIANALKFNDSERPTIEVGCGPEGAIFVRDNGIGIPPCHHESIFAMFRRLHSRRKYEGTGAGLTFVRKIVEAHGGRVWLESDLGSGSTFHFTLAPGMPSATEEPAHDPAG